MHTHMTPRYLSDPGISFAKSLSRICNSSRPSIIIINCLFFLRLFKHDFSLSRAVPLLLTFSTSDKIFEAFERSITKFTNASRLHRALSPSLKR